MVAMFGFESGAPCESGEQLCNLVDDWTGNQTLANISDLVIGKPLALLWLLILFLVVRWLSHRVIDRIVSRAKDGVLPDKMSRFGLRDRGTAAPSARELATQTRRVQRAKTMGDLLKSIVTGLLVAIFGTMALSELGVNIAPIIASAGIVGIALGFGAQSLVKDFLSGIFILAEDQFGVGDIVDLDQETSGTVEAVSLRTTRLRSVDGTVWHVPNGDIRRVGNMSQHWSRALLDIEVAYGTDLDHAKAVITRVANEVAEADDAILEPPDLWGVESLGAGGITLRLVVKTTPSQQWRVSRTLRERIKEAFDAEGIAPPPPPFSAAPGGAP